MDKTKIHWRTYSSSGINELQWYGFLTDYFSYWWFRIYLCYEMTQFMVVSEIAWVLHLYQGVALPRYGPLTRYVKLRVAHGPGMLGTFFPSPTSKETSSKRPRHPSRHVRHTRVVMHVGIANPRWRGKRTRHSRRVRNPQFYVLARGPLFRWRHQSTQWEVTNTAILIWCSRSSQKSPNTLSGWCDVHNVTEF